MTALDTTRGAEGHVEMKPARRPKRHHYLPRFLLENFALRRGSPQVRVLRGEGVFTAAASRVGVEKDFHPPGSSFPDPEFLLSKHESEFAHECRR